MGIPNYVSCTDKYDKLSIVFNKSSVLFYLIYIKNYLHLYRTQITVNCLPTINCFCPSSYKTFVSILSTFNFVYKMKLTASQNDTGLQHRNARPFSKHCTIEGIKNNSIEILCKQSPDHFSHTSLLNLDILCVSCERLTSLL